MKKTFLVRILGTCTKKEVRALRKWLHSPTHNQRQDVIQLFEYLVKEGQLENETQLEKAVIYQELFPEEAFDDAKMRQSIHFTTKAVEEFLIYQELRQDEVRAHTALGNVYRKRKLNKAFQKNMRTTEQLQKKQIYKNGEYLRNEYLIEQEQYYYLSGVKRLDLNLQSVSDKLDVTFVADKLRQSCLMLAHQSVYKKEDYETGILKQVLEFVQTKDFLDYPAIAIYYYTYLTQTEKENESHFQNLKREISEHGHLFPFYELRDIYILATNYCIGRLNAGLRNYARESFELFRQGLEQKILLDEGRLSRYTFINVVTIGNMLEEYDWIERFIYEYKDYLEEKYRDDIFHYSLARLHFEKGEYEEAIQLFNHMEYDDILMNLNAKMMLFKMLYEQGDLDVVESLLESIRNYLVRKKVIGYHRDNYKNIVRLTQKLLKVNPFSTAQRKKLQQEIETAQPLAERKWLLKQLEELE